MFAYYTPVIKESSETYYTYWNSVDSDKKKLPSNYTAGTVANFMYNQHVEWDASSYPEANGYVTSWTYSLSSIGLMK